MVPIILRLCEDNHPIVDQVIVFKPQLKSQTKANGPTSPKRICGKQAVKMHKRKYLQSDFTTIESHHHHGDNL